MDDPLFVTYINKLAERDIVVFNIWQHADKSGRWNCSLRVNKNNDVDCSFATEMSAGKALKLAYRKIFPAKKKKRVRR